MENENPKKKEQKSVNTRGGAYIAGNATVEGDVVRDKFVFNGPVTLHMAHKIEHYIARLITQLEDWQHSEVMSYIDLETELDWNTLQPRYSVLEETRANAGIGAVNTTVDSINGILDDLKKFVLLGEPGSGKTTSLRRVALKAADSYAEGSHIPLLVDLSKWDEEVCFEGYLDELWKEQDLPGKLKRFPVLLLLDSLNEISYQKVNLESRVQEISQFLYDVTHIRAIIACRQNDYTTEISLGLPQVIIQRLQDYQIRDYIDQQNVPELQPFIVPNQDEGQSYFGFIKTPLILAIFVDTYRHQRTKYGKRKALKWLSHSKGKLLERYTLWLWQRESDPRSHPTHWKHVPSKEIMQYALSELAFQMIQENVGSRINAGFARGKIPDTYKKDRICKDLLFRFSESANLISISQDGYSSLRFTHHLIQEYFAALAIKRRYSREKDFLRTLTYETHFSQVPTQIRSPWREAVTMFPDLCDGSKRILDKLFALDPFILADVPHLDPSNYKSLLDFLIQLIKKSPKTGLRIAALNCLAKLAELSSLNTLYEFEQEAETVEEIRAIHKVYQSIINKYGIDAFLRDLPQQDDRYPDQNLVWSWIKLKDVRYVYSPLFSIPINEHLVPLHAFIEEKNISTNSQVKIHPSDVKEAQVTDIDVVKQILRNCDENNKENVRLLLYFLKERWATKLALEMLLSSNFPASAAGWALIRSEYITPEDFSVALERHPYLISQLVFFIRKAPKLLPGFDELPDYVKEILSSKRVAQSIVTILDGARHLDEILALAFYVMPPETGFFVVANVFAEVLNRDEMPNQFFLDHWLSKVSKAEAVRVQIHQGIRKQLIAVASRLTENKAQLNNQIELNKSMLAARILGMLRQREAIPVLIQGTLAGNNEYAKALGDIGDSSSKVRRALIESFMRHKCTGAILSLGQLKVEESIGLLVIECEDLLPMLPSRYRAAKRTVPAILEALGEMGEQDKTVISIMKTVIAYETDQKSLTYYALAKKEASVALYKLLGQESISIIAPILSEVTQLKVPSSLPHDIYTLADEVLCLIEENPVQDTDVITACEELFEFLDWVREPNSSHPFEKIDKHLICGWSNLYSRLPVLLNKLRSKSEISYLRGVLGNRRGDWKEAIRRLSEIGSTEATKAMCSVFFNRRGYKGDYNPGGPYSGMEHDELCGLVTEEVIKNNSESCFIAFMEELDRWAELNDGYFDRNTERGFWLVDVSWAIGDMQRPATLRNYITALFSLVLREKVGMFLLYPLLWDDTALRMLIDEIEVDPATPHARLAMYMIQEYRSAKVDDEEKPAVKKQIEPIPTLAECIEVLNSGTLTEDQY